MSVYKTGIQPLCDKHHRPMTAITLPAGPESRLAYRCEQPGCQRNYTLANGYFDLVDERIFLGGQQTCCPRYGKPMYLAAFDEETKTHIWECPCVDCGPYQQMSNEEYLQTCPSCELLGE